MDRAESIEVVVGRIGKPHGLRGEVTVEVRTDEPDRRFAVGTTVRAERPGGSAAPWPELTVAATRWHQSTLLVRFEELTDRTTAEAARGLLLHADGAPPTSRPTTPRSSTTTSSSAWPPRTSTGRPLGEVTAVLHGAQDLLQIRTPDGRDALVPFVAALVPEVDVAGRPRRGRRPARAGRRRSPRTT